MSAIDSKAATILHIRLQVGIDYEDKMIWKDLVQIKHEHGEIAVGGHPQSDRIEINTIPIVATQRDLNESPSAKKARMNRVTNGRWILR